MRYVLDSCVALKWVLPEPDAADALRLRADFLAGAHEFLAPDVFPAEVAHGLTRAERRGIIPVGDAQVHTLSILPTAPHLYPILPLLWRAVALSSSARIGVRGVLHVALAEREGCELVTTDDRLVRVLGPSFPLIRSLATL